MVMEKFREFKNKILYSFEMMNSMGDEIYNQEEISLVNDTKSFDKLAEVLINLQYWEIGDAIHYSKMLHN